MLSIPLIQKSEKRIICEREKILREREYNVTVTQTIRTTEKTFCLKQTAASN